jgi:coproporphyrinogen III oxidase
MKDSGLTLDYIARRFQTLQGAICDGLEAIDGEGRFQEDRWERAAGGGGHSRVIQNGRVIEKGGVNFSHVFGTLPDKISEALKVEAGQVFHATGVSIVLHASHPYVPIIHMNVRYFELENGQYWFGGGIDVTPIYVNVAQAQKFHQRMKAVCDTFSPAYYPKFKEWCDSYFYLKHRKETRGIGGLFFDRLSGANAEEKAKLHQFVIAVGENFVPAYAELVSANQGKAFTQRELDWQAIRRSRYVEFNLLWDKGTKFGLDTDGRTESILMSMPPMARWIYDYHPAAGSPEADTLAALCPTDWLGLAQATENIAVAQP